VKGRVCRLAGFPLFVECAVPGSISQNHADTTAEGDQHTGVVMPLPDRAGFVSSLTLPVGADRLYHPPSRGMREAVERSNASVLAFLLQEVDLGAMPRPTDERLAAALAPLRIKLDMLIDMVARHAYRDVALPPLSAIELSPTNVVWHSRQYWRCGDWLQLELYFHPIFREPVCLLVSVTGCAEWKGENGDCRVRGNLVEMLESTREQLTRLAFLTQRQQQTRQRHRTGAGIEN
jgi:hypothetical protein